MLGLPAEDDEVQQSTSTQILARILSYLSSAELREARLVSPGFDKIITTHPQLFWAKNVFRIRIQSCSSESQYKREWTKLRLHKLITECHCPNFHFIKTDLLAPAAVGFFQSSVRYQIKYLKLTKCHVTNEVLIHILACVGRKLQHLEIGDFSKIRHTLPSEENFLESRSIPYLHLPRLFTLILSGQRYSRSSTNSNTLLNKSPEVELSWKFLHAILDGSCRLEQICLHECSPSTCNRFTKRLGSIDPGKLENVQTLELACTTDASLHVTQQYGFLKPLESVYLPNLRMLKINFDKNLNLDNEELPAIEREQFVEAMTNSIAVLIEGAAKTLESIELVNCPLSNNVFRAGINTLENLCFVNTSGSFITRLDDDANPVYEYSIPNRNLRRRRIHKRLSTNSDYETEIASDFSITSADMFATSTLTQSEAYKYMCVIFLGVALIHTSMQWAFGPYMGENLEIVIYAAIVLWINKGSEISELWTSAFLE